MKTVINNEKTKNKELYFEENFWTGKKHIIYDGVPLTKIRFNQYEYKTDETVETFLVKENAYSGIVVYMFGEQVEVVRKLVWYELALSLLVFLSCALFGAIGGGIGGFLFCENVILIRKIDKLWLKILISLEIAILGVLLSYILAIMIFRSFTFLF